MPHTAKRPGVREHLDEIKRLRFDEAWTLNELAKRYGVSAERIRQILIGCGPLVTRRQIRRVFHAVALSARLHLLETEGTTIPHGTYGRYNKAGCRCRSCRDAQAAKMRNYYIRSEKIRSNPTPPERQRAYRAVNNAIKQGRLTVPLECEGCGAEDRRTHSGGRWLQAHHEDYARPLDVVFLCCVCHRQIHARTSDG